LLFRAVLGSRSDVVNARDELAGEARKEARKPRETSKPPTERRQRAQPSSWTRSPAALGK
jgi:hypothetical protein